MKKANLVNRLLILMMSFLPLGIFAQVTISGPNCVVAGGTTGYQYTLSGAFTGATSIQWCVNGGTIVQNGQTCRTGTFGSMGPSIRVIWTPGATGISVTATTGIGNATLNVNNITISQTASPVSQTVNYNTSFTIIGGGPSSTICTPTYAYKWESASSAAGPFTALSGTASTVQNYIATANFTGTKYYRRKTTFNTTDIVYTNVASVTVAAFSAGTIATSTPSVNYNIKPVITNTAATGGGCTSYTYEWQQSNDGGPWIVIGTGQNYPSGAPKLLGNARIRRSVSCGNEVSFSNTLSFTINYTSANQENRNYIRTNEVWIRSVSSWIQADQLAIGTKQQSTTYFDGLGRPLQQVNMKMSPQQFDIVTPMQWDASGREPLKYLSYRSGLQDGKYKPNAVTDQLQFLTSGGTPFYPGETRPYTEVTYEQSPLNRTLASLAPGAQWGGAGRKVSMEYQVNTASEDVRIWTIADAQGSIPVTSAAYADGDLTKMVTTDEDNNTVIEYQDKEGKVILKKVQLSATPSTQHDGWLCTYYVYDNMRNLRFVIPPKGVNDMTLNLRPGYVRWQVHPDVSSFLCFRYEYDSRGRMIIKKIPGADEVHMVYDARDRLVLTQDGNLRTAGKWAYTTYDEQNRPLTTGLWISSLLRTNHQSSADISVNYPGVVNTDPNVEEMTKTFYDNYAWAGTTGLTSSLISTHINATNFITTYNASPLYAQQQVATAETRGMVTGSMTKVLGTTINLYSLSIFDDRMRVIQTKSQNHTIATDVATSQYDFSGKILRSHLAHEKGGNNAQTHTLLTKYTYDLNGRLKQLNKNIDNLADKVISKLTYDELGQLSKKDLGTHPVNTTQPLESLNYEYNIRGWLKSINKAYAEGEGANTSNYFGQVLTYGAGGHAGKEFYNGNIASTNWKSKGDAIQRRYQFDYDKSNRLTHAEFGQRNATGSSYSSTWTKDKVDFTVSNLNYDANGNILSMNQMGVKINTPQFIDKLNYTYIINTNRLFNINDSVKTDNKLGDFLDAPVSYGLEYSYDQNGNTTSDDNNGGNSKIISYNHLNLVTEALIIPKGLINYTYDATGNKTKKVVTDYTLGDPITTHYDYVNAFQYLNDTLILSFHEEGRLRYIPASGSIPASFIYDYFIKDHLGNIRAVITEQSQQQTYPAATLENPVESLNEEKKYYTILDAQVVDKSTVPGITDYPNNNGNPPYNPNPHVNTNDLSQKVYKLNGNSAKTGLGITLKVMAGDRVDIFAKSYFYLGGTPVDPQTNPVDILSLLADFAGSMAVSGANKGVTASALQNSPNVTAPLNNWLATQGGSTSTLPKAFLNWVLFDEQFNPVISSTNTNSGFDQVGPTEGVVKNHFKTTGEILRSGYLYVYVSDESPVNVFFDNLQVIHTKGQLLEETHYYPFGLTMMGISSKIINKSVQNKNKFNRGNELQNEEFVDGTGLEIYDAVNRVYDPQIGRFLQIDELSETNWEWTPYNYSINNPILYNDPLGLKEGPNDVKTLPEVVVVAKKKLSHNEMQSVYWQLRDKGIDFSRVKSGALRERLYRWDGIQRHMDKIHEMTRKQDKVILEIGSFFIPGTQILKLRYLRTALVLFKTKRGGQITLSIGKSLIARNSLKEGIIGGGADLVSQTITNSIKYLNSDDPNKGGFLSYVAGNWNIAATAGNFGFKNALTSSLISTAGDGNLYALPGNFAGDVIGNIPMPGILGSGLKSGISFTLGLWGNQIGNVITEIMDPQKD